MNIFSQITVIAFNVAADDFMREKREKRGGKQPRLGNCYHQIRLGENKQTNKQKRKHRQAKKKRQILINAKRVIDEQRSRTLSRGALIV